MVRTVFGVVLAACGLCASQGDLSLGGRVLNAAAPVGNAIVTISGEEIVKSVTTDGDGRYEFQGIPAGRYDLRISAPHYAVFERPVVVHAHESHRNWVEITSLLPADQQTVSVRELSAQKQTGIMNDLRNITDEVKTKLFR